MHNNYFEECDEFRYITNEKDKEVREMQYETGEFTRFLTHTQTNKNNEPPPLIFNRLTPRQRKNVMPIEIKLVYNLKIALKKAYRYSRDASEWLARFILCNPDVNQPT